jgi:hypothetical protein
MGRVRRVSARGGVEVLVVDVVVDAMMAVVGVVVVM